MWWRRLQYHRNQGSIFLHYIDNHDKKTPLQKLIDSTTILHRESNHRKLQIAESVAITVRHPNINVQLATDFILPSVRPQTAIPDLEESSSQSGSSIMPGPGRLNQSTARRQARISSPRLGSRAEPNNQSGSSIPPGPGHLSQRSPL